MAIAAGSTCCCLFFLFLVWSITNWWMAPKLGADGLAHLLTPMSEWEQQGVSLWAAETQLSQQIIDQLREHKVDGNALIALSEESNAMVVAELGVTHLAAKVLRRRISRTLEEETGASRDARTASKADEVKKAGKKRAKRAKKKKEKKKTGTSDAWTLFGGPANKAEGGGDLDADAERVKKKAAAAEAWTLFGASLFGGGDLDADAEIGAETGTESMEDAGASSEGGGGWWWGWKTWVLLLVVFLCFTVRAQNREAALRLRIVRAQNRAYANARVGELGGQEQRVRMRARLNPGPDPLQRAAQLDLRDLQRQLTESQGLTAELQRKMDLANVEKDILVRFAVAEDAAALLSALQELSALPLLNEGMAPHKQGLLLIGKARRNRLGPKRTDGGEDEWTKEIASIYGRLLKIAQ